MLTTYVVNRMHHITVYFFCLCFCYKFGTNRLREALTVLKCAVDHRSHTLDGCLGAVTQATVKTVFFGHIFMHIPLPNFDVSQAQKYIVWLWLFRF